MIKTARILTILATATLLAVYSAHVNAVKVESESTCATCSAGLAFPASQTETQYAQLTFHPILAEQSKVKADHDYTTIFQLHMLDKLSPQNNNNKNNNINNINNINHIIASASYSEQMESTGWDALNIATVHVDKANDVTQSFAAGILEGALTPVAQITAMLQSIKEQHKDNQSPINRFMLQHAAYLRTQLYRRKLYSGVIEEMTQAATAMLDENENDDDDDVVHTKAMALVLEVEKHIYSSNWFKQQLIYLQHKSSQTQMSYQHKPILSTLALQESSLQTQESNMIWFQASLIVAQLDGLRYGYYLQTGHVMSELDAWLLQSDGDINDLNKVTADVTSIPVEDLERYYNMHSHCTAIIKLHKKKLIAGHVSWESYGEMFRVFKHISMQLSSAPQGKSVISFSSYPGFLSSSDDYILTDKGLLFIETSIGIMSSQTRALIRPQGVLLGWMRSIIASRLALTSSDFAFWMSQFNSGTLNSQWYALDMGAINRKAEQSHDEDDLELPPYSAVMLEQVPGLVQSMDVTKRLQEKGFLYGINTPQQPLIREASGIARIQRHWKSMLRFLSGSQIHANRAKLEVAITNLDHESNPRARIIRSQINKIVDESSMGEVLRRNRYWSDSASYGCPSLALSARFDIAADEDSDCPERVLSYFGGTDGKVTSSKWAASMLTSAISGPAWAGEPSILQSVEGIRVDEENVDDRLPPFSWLNVDDDSDNNDNDSLLETGSSELYQEKAKSKPVVRNIAIPFHSGQPDEFKFGWYAMAADSNIISASSSKSS